MVQFWSSLATRRHRHDDRRAGAPFPAQLPNAEWATYIRCHDDIGWAITEEDAERGGLTGPATARFLVDFYAGRLSRQLRARRGFPGERGDGRRAHQRHLRLARRAGTALDAGDAAEIDLAVERILMGHALIAAFGGMPLIYMGDEIGLLNDMGYRDDPDRAADGRWMQRPSMDWDAGAAPDGRRRRPDPRRHRDHPVGPRGHARNSPGSVPSRSSAHRARPALFAVRRPGAEAALVALFNFTAETAVDRGAPRRARPRRLPSTR